MAAIRNVVRVSAAFVLATLASGTTSLAEQAWPQRAVKVILPLGPGSGADTGARLIAERLATRWGRSVVVENRPGGDGIVAITAFLSAKDGHTLLYSPTSSFTAHPWLHDKLPYDARDLVPIARVSNSIVAVAVPASTPISTMADLVSLARKEPGKLNWATITGMFDFMFAGFLKKHNLDIAKVPYRDTVQAVTDLSQGRIQLMLSAVSILRPHVQSGRVRMIALTAHERTSLAPGVPTTTEAGFPDLAIDGLSGFFGTRDTPTDVRDRISADVRAAAVYPAVSARLLAIAQIVNPGDAAAFGAAIDAQRAQVAAVGELLGIKPVQN
jgi:tripartite-type tricarboxylate transporter receptor subunit TctC